jgi:hypothetical protein
LFLFFSKAAVFWRLLKKEAYREAVGILLAQRFVAIVADKLQ